MELIITLVVITFIWIILKRTIYKEKPHEYPEVLKRLFKK